MKQTVFVSFYSNVIPRHRLMAKTLADNGRSISLITWERSAEDSIIYDEKWMQSHFPIKIKATAGRASLLLRLPVLYFKVLKTIHSFPDIDAIFLTHYFLLPLAPLVKIFNRTVAIYYDAPEYYCEDFLAYFKVGKKIARPLIRGLEMVLLRFVNAVSTIDSKNGWLFEYYKHSDKPVEMIINAPSKEDEPTQEAINLATLDIGREQIVAFVGSLKYAKGLEEMLRTVPLVKKSFPDVRFLFIGNLQEESSQIESLITSLGIKEQVIFKPFMPYQQMLAYLYCATIGLAILQKYRNHMAGAGNCRKIFSYMQSGIPVVVSDVGSIGHYVKEHDVGTCIAAESSEQAAEAIIRYLENNELAQQHGNKGRNLFESLLNWEIESEKYLRFINGNPVIV